MSRAGAVARKLCLAGVAGISIAASASAQVNFAPFESGIMGSNGFWFREECLSADQRRRDRCDGFIQGIAATLRARRFPYCQATRTSAELRSAVVPRLSGFDRKPAPFAVEAALNRAFPCRIPPKRPPAAKAPQIR